MYTTPWNHTFNIWKNLKLEPVIVLDERRRYVAYLLYYLLTRNLFEIKLCHQVDDVICQLHFSRDIRKRSYCNNLATRAIPLIVSKSAVGEKISKTLLPHFLSTLLPQIFLQLHDHYGKLLVFVEHFSAQLQYFLEVI